MASCSGTWEAELNDISAASTDIPFLLEYVPATTYGIIWIQNLCTVTKECASNKKEIISYLMS